MHPDLSAHLHTEECNKLIAEFQRCHREHPFKKFIGECNDHDRLVWNCLKKERIRKRNENAQGRQRENRLREEMKRKEAES